MKKMIGVWLALFAVNIFAVEPVISRLAVVPSIFRVWVRKNSE